MILLSQNGIITESDDKTNIILEFIVPKNINKITVNYSYSPKTIEDNAKAASAVSKGIKKYGINPVNASSFLPVKNLVTLSFDECSEYRGACHRQPNEQSIIICKNESTPGIINREIKEGIWHAVLNVHYAGCKINYNIEIIGEEK